MQLVTKEERETIARLRNCIVALVQQRIMLFDTSIQYTYDASLRYEVSITIIMILTWNLVTVNTSTIDVHWNNEKSGEGGN